ncbi:MAG: glycosyltransferase family 2 protein [Ignavibacteriales bacterium]|nr:MAG: glycosyltransferase family 2 protein [Ignavibacteriaceae bacterium]MBW7874296.1 hypothetical protein [Ignavibacteria bacterium]MCZ2143223.1 glycosyltransferase family 2 protein [Ignavibacteriales bacterium]MBV6444103.1 hypothetical protein [Ignavibacteriaceae bacterium]MBZ0196589.1 glycosyltransferase family 2 protein [Ignavibacteriaceae bacterium]
MVRVDTAVLVIAFNRPEMLRKVLDSLSEHRFRKIYAFVDGPRNGVTEDIEKVEKCREMVGKIDFCGELETMICDDNLGCGLGPFSAITQAFEQEKQLIILEDDCVPTGAFFQFCEEIFERYANEPKVWMISGNNFSEGVCPVKGSYVFSTYAHFGGWGTWKRSWETVVYDSKILLNRLNKESYAGNHSDNPLRFASKKEAKFFMRIYRQNFEKPDYEGWDYQASIAMRKVRGLSVVPKQNLVSNIGVVGTHFSGEAKFFNLPIAKNFKVTEHPMEIKADKEYDNCHFRKHWIPMNRRSLCLRVKTKLKKLRWRFGW